MASPHTSSRVETSTKSKNFLVWIILIAILIAGLVLRIPRSDLLIEFGSKGDYPRELMAGFRLIHTSPFTFQPKYQNTFVQILTDVRGLNTPLIPFVTGYLTYLLDIPLTERKVYLAFSFVAVLDLLILFFLARKLGGHLSGIIAATLLAILPIHLWASHHKTHYLLSVFLDGAFLLAWLKALEVATKRYLLLSSLLLSLVIFIDSWFLGIIAVAASIWWFSRRTKVLIHPRGSPCAPSIRTLLPFFLPPASLVGIQIVWASYAIFWSGSHMGMIPYIVGNVGLLQPTVKGLVIGRGLSDLIPGLHVVEYVRFLSFAGGLGVTILIGYAIVNHLSRWSRLSPAEKGTFLWFSLNALPAFLTVTLLPSGVYVLFPGLILGANSFARLWPAAPKRRFLWGMALFLLLVSTLAFSLIRVFGVKVPAIHQVVSTSVPDPKRYHFIQHRRDEMTVANMLNYGQDSRWIWKDLFSIHLLMPKVENIGQKSLGYWIRQYSSPEDLIWVTAPWFFTFIAEYYTGKQVCICGNNGKRVVIGRGDPDYERVTYFIHMLKIELEWERAPTDLIRRGIVRKVGIIKRGEEELVHIYSKKDLPLRVIDVFQGDRLFDQEYGRIDKITPTAYVGYSQYLP